MAQDPRRASADQGKQFIYSGENRLLLADYADPIGHRDTPRYTEIRRESNWKLIELEFDLGTEIGMENQYSL